MTKVKEYLPNWVGFEGMFDTLDSIMEGNRRFVTQNFPPYNIKRTGPNSYVIEMALAGFGKSDVELTLEGDQLKISGKMDQKSEDFLYKGISERSFAKTFTLADSVVVKNAELLNGMLKVILDRVVPEAKSAKKIEVK